MRILEAMQVVLSKPAMQGRTTKNYQEVLERHLYIMEQLWKNPANRDKKKKKKTLTWCRQARSETG